MERAFIATLLRTQFPEMNELLRFTTWNGSVAALMSVKGSDQYLSAVIAPASVSRAHQCLDYARPEENGGELSDEVGIFYTQDTPQDATWDFASNVESFLEAATAQ